jgi:outer membrane protein assembly factor BamB
MVDDQLLVGPFARGVVALDPDTLAERWSYKASGVSDMSRVDSLLYYSTARADVEALRLDSKQLAWRFKAKEGALGAPLVIGHWLLVSSSVHSLLVLDRWHGKLLQIFNPGKGASSLARVHGNRVYWMSNGQTLYCFEIAQLNP